MLTPYTITDYSKEYKPNWACNMPEGCPPDNILVPSQHSFFRLAKLTSMMRMISNHTQKWTLSAIGGAAAFSCWLVLDRQ